VTDIVQLRIEATLRDRLRWCGLQGLGRIHIKTSSAIETDSSMAIKIEYDITLVDHVAKLERFVQGSSVGRNFTWFAYFAIAGLAWLSALLFYIKQGDQNYRYMVSGAFALVLTLTLPVLYRWYQKLFLASVFTPEAVRGIVGRKVLTIHDDFIEEVGDVFTVQAKWRDIKRIDHDSVRTWVICAPLLAFLIPNNAFQDSNSRDAFLNECRTRIAEQSVGHGAANSAV